uniref:TTC29 protein n=3 Tax=Bos TaxID=9903 RepID=A8WFG0_BOVIN|nr:TTC29 protein [Bos taurus]
MTTLPPLPMTRPKLTALARQKLPCSPRTKPRSELIKEKDDIDHYLEVNFKGLSKEEVAAVTPLDLTSLCGDHVCSVCFAWMLLAVCRLV